MSVLAQGTIVVEAADKSGTLTQAKAALKQGRKLFILKNNFENTSLSWPKQFESMGAVCVESIDDIDNTLAAEPLT